MQRWLQREREKKNEELDSEKKFAYKTKNELNK